MKPSFPESMRALAAALLLAGAGVQAAPAAVESFDVPGWKRLQAEAAKPTVVVFTATYCAYCPAVIDQMAREIRQRKLDATLVTVVIDAAPGEADAALLRDAHHRAAARLFAFAGPQQALRYAVNPRWPGVTPYVAFLGPQQARPSWVVGAPVAADIESWLGAWGLRR